MTVQDPSKITGNAPEDVKRVVGDPVLIFLGKRSSNDGAFGASIIKRLTVKEVAVVDKFEEPRKKEGRVVCEVVAKEGASRATTLHHAFFFGPWRR